MWRYFGSSTIAAGENPEWIARQMGHSSTEMLFRVYSRYVPDITRQDGSAMDNLLLASKEQLSNKNTKNNAKESNHEVY